MASRGDLTDAEWALLEPLHIRRNEVERPVNGLKNSWAVATRYDCEDDGVPPWAVVWLAIRLAVVPCV
ncbi:hypothetical protein GCM10010339_92390 [Streptomyces alanosinicus]|uniref:Transposase n=1 Tax=Streptomyces alanosinicus TaxID=68171 RepID=A0A919D8A3_9ACTN|nr:hypothetical protein GCM10010339_92390 [Streptomyces alanosinicus]